MALAQAQLLTIYPVDETVPLDPFLYETWQSYWIDQKVVFQQGAVPLYSEFRTFDTGVIVNSSTGDAQTLSVSLPATDEAHNLVQTSILRGHVWQVTIVQFEAFDKQALPEIPNATVDDDRRLYEGGDLLDPAEYRILARFYGQVASASADTTTISLELGPSLSPTGSQVPPRKYVSSLIGAPLRL